jgi:signal transduction histidine kinase
MADTADTVGSAEDGDLARAISVAGLSISQAADELQQAAERLIAAEEQAREADARVAAVDEQLAQAALKSAELLTLVQEAKSAQVDADERARSAELRAQKAVERAAKLEEDSQGYEARIKELEEQIRTLEARLLEAEQAPAVTVIVDDERAALQEAVAAEVRRPLTSILGITLALKHTDSGSPDGREMIRQLATNARKLDRLVGEMLDVDRIASGTFTPNLRRTDLEALVRRVVEESPDLANRDVKIKTAHVAIQVDPALTEQMVESLLANAGRRTVPGSQVWVGVSAEPGGAVVAVDDAGPEVPPGLRQAMFAAMQDGNADRGRPRGATGLALLSKLAEIHGGRCWVEEGPGGGASFRVYLPDATAKAEEAVTAREEERTEAGEEPEAALVGTDEQERDLEEGSIAS